MIKEMPKKMSINDKKRRLKIDQNNKKFIRLNLTQKCRVKAINQNFKF